LVHDLDAVADLAVAESVHSLVRGKVPAAAAALTAAASGDVSFPPMTVADTPRPALQITHRLLLLVDPDGTSAWPAGATSGRALAARGLEAWASALPGAPGDLHFEIRFEAPTATAAATPEAHSLAEVGLSALDVLFLGPGGDEVGLGRLGPLLAA